MDVYNKYYLLESGGLKDVADKYCDDRRKALKEIFEYAASLGAVAVSMGLEHKVAGFIFRAGESPSDFTKPGRRGECRPKSKKKYAKFYELETPWAYKYLKEVIDPPTSLTWRHKDDEGAWGMMHIGNFVEPVAVYRHSSDSPMLVVPDVARHASELRAEIQDRYPGKEIVFDNADDEWCLNAEGAREILAEE